MEAADQDRKDAVPGETLRPSSSPVAMTAAAGGGGGGGLPLPTVDSATVCHVGATPSTVDLDLLDEEVGFQVMFHPNTCSTYVSYISLSRFSASSIFTRYSPPTLGNQTTSKCNSTSKCNKIGYVLREIKVSAPSTSPLSSKLHGQMGETKKPPTTCHAAVAKPSRGMEWFRSIVAAVVGERQPRWLGVTTWILDRKRSAKLIRYDYCYYSYPYSMPFH